MVFLWHLLQLTYRIYMRYHIYFSGREGCCNSLQSQESKVTRVDGYRQNGNCSHFQQPGSFDVCKYKKKSWVVQSGRNLVVTKGTADSIFQICSIDCCWQIKSQHLKLLNRRKLIGTIYDQFTNNDNNNMKTIISSELFLILSFPLGNQSVTPRPQSFYKFTENTVLYQVLQVSREV